MYVPGIIITKIRHYIWFTAMLSISSVSQVVIYLEISPPNSCNSPTGCQLISFSPHTSYMPSLSNPPTSHHPTTHWWPVTIVSVAHFQWLAVITTLIFIWQSCYLPPYNSCHTPTSSRWFKKESCLIAAFSKILQNTWPNHMNKILKRISVIVVKTGH